MLRAVQPAAVCLYKNNIESPEQVRRLIRAIKELFPPALEPLVAVDEEGGVVSRMGPEGFLLPGAMALGAVGSAELARDAGRDLGLYLATLGFDINFARVLELATNPASRTIGTRAFSDDPRTVAELGTAFILAQREGGLIAVAQHFPGHGAAQIDSHARAPELSERSFDELEAGTSPFGHAIRDAHVDGIMVAHATARALTGNDAPVTFSPAVLTGFLRGRMRFEGVVVTDALVMESVLRSMPITASGPRAVQAGADLLLLPGGPIGLVHRALAEAIQSGAIPSVRTNDAIRRVFELREARQRARREPRGSWDPETPSSDREPRGDHPSRRRPHFAGRTNAARPRRDNE